jgi:hypothetical protein
MISIILHPARNGVIKKVVDDNYSGNNESFTATDVYEKLPGDGTDKEYIKRFFYDICEELGLDIGNKFNKNVLKIESVWGTHYEPSSDEVNSKIQELEAELNLLKEWSGK